jgi:AhpD family alkylhydroperoxidase
MKEKPMAAEYKLTMSLRSIDDVEEKGRPLLEKAKAQLGFVPNMYGTMVNSPGLLATYMDGYERFRRDSGFTPAEQEVVFLTISRFNGCEYCLAAHSFLADKMSKVPGPVTDAIRDDQPVPDAKLAALSAFTALMLETRGMPPTAGVRAFLDAGYGEGHVLEIILAIAVKTLSNYSNHLLHTPLDPVFAPRAWAAPACACETGHGR